MKSTGSVNYKLLLTVLVVLFSLASLAILLQVLTTRSEPDYKNDFDITRQLKNAVFTSMQSGIESLTGSPSVTRLLSGTAECDNEEILNTLDTVRRLFDSSLVYITDKDGTVTACTPFDGGKTLTGNNYSFRPYIQSALRGESTVYPALGVTTDERGLYFSNPVKKDLSGEIIGIIIVKIGLEKIDELIKSYKDPVFLLSPNKVVIATNYPDYLFHFCYPKKEDEINTIRESRQFGDSNLEPMPVFFDRKSIKFLDTPMRIHRESFLDPSWELIVLQENRQTFIVNKKQIIIVFLFILLQLIVIFYLYWNIQVRKKTERDLRKSRKNHQTLFRLAPEGICISRMNGDLLSYNEEFNKLFKFSADSARSINTRDLYVNPEEDRSLLLRELNKKGEIKNLPVNFRDAQFHELKTISSFAIIDYNGEPCIESIIRDITEIEEKEQMLRQAQKMEIIGALSSGLAHDFNNLIGGIASVVSLLKLKIKKERIIPTAELEENLEIMEQTLKRINELIRQLLSFSRNTQFSIETVDLTDVVEEVLNICRNSFNRSIKIREILPESPLLVKGNATQLEQVLLNLCINASHAMTIMRSGGESGGILTIAVNKNKTDSGDFWRISVADTGIGIAPEHQDNLFKPFFTTKKHDQGSGLGLMMVKNIIEQHRGRIDLKTKPGEGTTFFIDLPAAH